jgi:hypothetical protein
LTALSQILEDFEILNSIEYGKNSRPGAQEKFRKRKMKQLPPRQAVLVRDVFSQGFYFYFISHAIKCP